MRRCFVAALAVALAVARPIAGPSRQDDSADDKAKAEVVSKLPQFVEWPAAAVEGRSALDLCVAAPDSVGAALRALVVGESVKGLPLAVRGVTTEADVARCHVLFLSAASGDRSAWLKRAAPRPILTVGDSPRFLDAGGIVALRLVDGRWRFDINASAAERAGLRISSQLLQLAVTVRGAE